MKKFNKLILLLVTIINVVRARAPMPQEISNLTNLTALQSAHISPEIINDLKDFENLIPEATVDEIIAEHFLMDKNFRTVLKYLRSYEFTQLQKQLLNVPEIINILEFLHLTTANATTSHMGATKIPTIARVKASLDEYNDDAAADSDNRVAKVTTNTGTIISKPNTITTENSKEEMNKKKVPKRSQQQQFYIKEDNNKNVGVDDGADENANSHATLSNEQQTSVRIVLLEELEVKARIHNRGHNTHHYKYHRQYNNHYRSSLGTFTTFVEDILQHLPHSAFQSMIKDKCKKNAKFAEFYQALRSDEFKSVIEQAKSTANIKKIIQTLGSHDVDVNALEPIAFKVISWGPAI